MISSIGMRFDPTKPSPPAWEGELLLDGSSNPDYERYLMGVIENYPETVTIDVTDLRYTDILRWAQSARDFEFDHDLARDLIAFLIGAQR
jgi:hypothetical protein